MDHPGCVLPCFGVFALINYRLLLCGGVQTVGPQTSDVMYITQCEEENKSLNCILGPVI